jgi:hypothetical protein
MRVGGMGYRVWGIERVSLKFAAADFVVSRSEKSWGVLQLMLQINYLQTHRAPVLNCELRIVNCEKRLVE